MRDGANGDVVDGVNITVRAAVVQLQSSVTCRPHEDAALSSSALTTATEGEKKTRIIRRPWRKMDGRDN